VILDTHAFLWFALSPDRVPQPLLASLRDPSVPVFLSALVCWELAIKHRSGKLRAVDDLDPFIEAQRQALVLTDLPVRREHALRTQGLPSLHGDPFDRLLVAQALVEGLPLVTNDRMIRRYSVPIVWDG